MPHGIQHTCAVHIPVVFQSSSRRPHIPLRWPNSKTHPHMSVARLLIICSSLVYATQQVTSPLKGLIQKHQQEAQQVSLRPWMTLLGHGLVSSTNLLSSLRPPSYQPWLWPMDQYALAPVQTQIEFCPSVTINFHELILCQSILIRLSIEVTQLARPILPCDEDSHS